jgi:hypothetical protein
MPPTVLSRRDLLIQRAVTTTLLALAASLVCVGVLLYL